MTDSKKVAAVTGAARGIGFGVAQWFLTQGFRVALMDNDASTLKTSLEAVQQALAVQGRPVEDALGCVCDVSQPDQVQAAFVQISQHFGRLDALVNNAGVAVFKPAQELTFAEWRYVLDTNLDGAFNCTQAAVPLMLQNAGSEKGSIVNVASISGLRASTLRVAYGTSKAALMHLTKQYAVELGTQGIRVNAIAPGPVETEMAKLVHSVAIRSDYYDTIPQNRYGTVAEMAQTIGFLCSSQASFINGQILAVDGGFDAAGVGIPTLRKNLGLA